MATKAYRRFVQRVDYYNSDLELCDLLVRRFAGIPNSNASVAEALGSTNDRRPYLGRRMNTRASRMICGNHLKHTLYVAFIKDLFEDFSEFLAETMTKAALKGIDPQRFVGSIKLEISASDLLAAGSWDAAVKMISDAIFRKMENERNTRDLIKKASDRLGLQLDQSLLDTAMPYLDARHILVHRDGRTDDLYRRDYPTIRLDGASLVVDYAFATQAEAAIKALAKEIDDKIISANLCRPQDLDGGR